MLRLLCVALALLLFAGPALAQQKLKVIASFSILADIVAQVGGDRVEVDTLVPVMGDAHVYQPTPSDARGLAGADVLVSNGLNFEPWLDRLVEASGFKGQRIVATANITPRHMGNDTHSHDHGHKHSGGAAVTADPHLWHDLQRMPQYLANIVDGLAAADPANREHYRRRGGAYTAELKELDTWAAAQFSALPKAHRRAITQHDAFGYLADRYDIEFLAAQGVTTESQASAEGVARLIRQIKRQQVQAIFFENVTNPRLIEQIATDAKVKVGGRLYSDALSPAGGEADAYVKMYRLNVDRLIAAMRRD